LHVAPSAEAFDFDKTGNSNAAKMAMMAMTTKSSIKVNARLSPICRIRNGIKDYKSARIQESITSRW
jgi:hypothetical protein